MKRQKKYLLTMSMILATMTILMPVGTASAQEGVPTELVDVYPTSVLLVDSSDVPYQNPKGSAEFSFQTTPFRSWSSDTNIIGTDRVTPPDTGSIITSASENLYAEDAGWVGVGVNPLVTDSAIEAADITMYMWVRFNLKDAVERADLQWEPEYIRSMTIYETGGMVFRNRVSPLITCEMFQYPKEGSVTTGWVPFDNDFYRKIVETGEASYAASGGPYTEENVTAPRMDFVYRGSRTVDAGQSTLTSFISEPGGDVVFRIGITVTAGSGDPTSIPEKSWWVGEGDGLYLDKFALVVGHSKGGFVIDNPLLELIYLLMSSMISPSNLTNSVIIFAAVLAALIPGAFILYRQGKKGRQPGQKFWQNKWMLIAYVCIAVAISMVAFAAFIIISIQTRLAVLPYETSVLTSRFYHDMESWNSRILAAVIPGAAFMIVQFGFGFYTSRAKKG